MIPRLIYVMTSRDREGVKVGMAFDVERRAKELGKWRRGHPLTIEFVAPALVGKGAVTEKLAHWALREHATTGEWFSVTVQTAASAIVDAIEQTMRPDWTPPWGATKRYVERQCVGDKTMRLLLSSEHAEKLHALACLDRYGHGGVGLRGKRMQAVRRLVAECYDRLQCYSQSEAARHSED